MRLEANAVDVDRLNCYHEDADSTSYVQQRSTQRPSTAEQTANERKNRFQPDHGIAAVDTFRRDDVIEVFL